MLHIRLQQRCNHESHVYYIIKNPINKCKQLLSCQSNHVTLKHDEWTRLPLFVAVGPNILLFHHLRRRECVFFFRQTGRSLRSDWDPQWGCTDNTERPSVTQTVCKHKLCSSVLDTLNPCQLQHCPQAPLPPPGEQFSSTAAPGHSGSATYSLLHSPFSNGGDPLSYNCLLIGL